MMRPVLAASLALALALALSAPPSTASTRTQAASHQFGIVGHSFTNGGGEARLRQALAQTGDADLAFVVVTAIKGANEPCSDALYGERRNLLDDARRPLVPVLAASDWSECRNPAGRSIAIERLNRLREVLFAETASLGTRKLVLTRLSANAKFRSYAENAHWVVGNVLYATVNLPANNNNYRPEAGRNSEFEDRLVANRNWLKRLFGQAKRMKFDAIVLFSEGDVRALTQATGLRALLTRSSGQDGFAEPRRQIVTLAAKFPGRVLLVDTAAVANGSEPAIEWRDNLGHVSVGADAFEVRVSPGARTMFTLTKAGAH